MDYLKFGNVEFCVSSFPFKTKREFMSAYKSDVFKFDKEKAWSKLKQYVTKKNK